MTISHTIVFFSYNINITIRMIILMGLPKSGTCSFQKLFSDLGFVSYHYKKNNKFIAMLILRNKHMQRPLLYGFNSTDVITQMDICINAYSAYWPQIVDYERLYLENKDSIFILNKRNPEKLLESFKRWNKYNERLVKFNPEILNKLDDKSFIEFVLKHYENIETFFSKHPDSKFISFDIERDNLEILSKYIDLKNIKTLPRENSNN